LKETKEGKGDGVSAPEKEGALHSLPGCSVETKKTRKETVLICAA
jgi:hypothetical protein